MILLLEGNCYMKIIDRSVSPAEALLWLEDQAEVMKGKLIEVLIDTGDKIYRRSSTIVTWIADEIIQLTKHCKDARCVICLNPVPA